MKCCVFLLSLFLSGCSQWLNRQESIIKITEQYHEQKKTIEVLQQDLERISKEIDQIKQVLPRVVNVMEMQKTGMENLEQKVKQLNQFLSTDQDR